MPEWYESMRKTMQQMTRVVSTIAVTSPSHPSLKSRIPLFRMLNDQMWSSVGATLLSAAAQSQEKKYITQADEEVYITTFSALLIDLLSQLDRFGSQLSSANACSIGTAGEEVFWELWRFLNISSLGFEAVRVACKGTWPVHTCNFQTLLFAAFQSLLNWLLSMLQCPAWRSMTLMHGLECRTQDLLDILRPLLHSLHTHSTASDDSFVDHTRLLPPNLLPMLCSVLLEETLCGHLGAVNHEARALHPATNYAQGLKSKHLQPLNQEFPDQLHLCVVSIGNFASAGCATMNCNAPCSWLGHPAVFQLLKTALTLPCMITKPDLWNNSLDSLVFLINYRTVVYGSQRHGTFPHSTTGTARTHNALSVLDSIPDKSTSDRSSASNPWLSPNLSFQALQSDARLLHTLSRLACSNSSPERVNKCLGVQLEVLLSWSESCERHAAPTASMLLITQSVVGIGKKCASRGLEIMHNLQQLRLAGPPNQHKQRSKKRAGQRKVHADASATLAVAAVPDEVDFWVMQKFWCLTVNTLYLLLRVPHSILPHRPGKDVVVLEAVLG